MGFWVEGFRKQTILDLRCGAKVFGHRVEMKGYRSRLCALRLRFCGCSRWGGTVLLVF